MHKADDVCIVRVCRVRDKGKSGLGDEGMPPPAAAVPDLGTAALPKDLQDLQRRAGVGTTQHGGDDGE